MILTTQIQTAVKAQAEKHHLNLATNDGYNRAYQLARMSNRELFASNDGLPTNVTITEDGQTMSGGWPVPPERLTKLGLPVKAKREAYEIFQRAADTKITPEIAAVIVRSLIQFSQLERALSFDDALSFLEKHRPEIFKLALEVSKPQTP